MISVPVRGDSDAASMIVRCTALSRQFGRATALDSVNLTIAAGEIVGLVGRNGCGKTTLLHHIAGLALPSSGTCLTFDTATSSLGPAELARIGFVQQHPMLIGFMRVEQLVAHVKSFYERWDDDLASALLNRLEVQRDARVSALSPGNRQKLALVLALSHRPELLLLDEPLSDLDPLARKDVLSVLLERQAADHAAILLSSHLLHDIEPIVGRVVCLDHGRVCVDSELDVLKETFSGWYVSARDTPLPTEWSEPWIVHAEGDRFSSCLIVRNAPKLPGEFSRAHDVDVSVRALNLEQLFPMLIRQRGSNG